VGKKNLPQQQHVGQSTSYYLLDAGPSIGDWVTNNEGASKQARETAQKIISFPIRQCSKLL